MGTQQHRLLLQFANYITTRSLNLQQWHMGVAIILGRSMLSHLPVKYSNYAVAAENISDDYFLHMLNIMYTRAEYTFCELGVISSIFQVTRPRLREGK